MEDVRNCLRDVAQFSFSDSNEQTQWSIVFSTSALTAEYFIRENYETGYTAMLRNKGGWLYKNA